MAHTPEEGHGGAVAAETPDDDSRDRTMLLVDDHLFKYSWLRFRPNMARASQAHKVYMNTLAAANDNALYEIIAMNVPVNRGDEPYRVISGALTLANRKATSSQGPGVPQPDFSDGLRPGARHWTFIRT